MSDLELASARGAMALPHVAGETVVGRTEDVALDRTGDVALERPVQEPTVGKNGRDQAAPVDVGGEMKQDLVVLGSRLGKLSLENRALVLSMVERFVETHQVGDNAEIRKQGAIPKTHSSHQSRREQQSRLGSEVSTSSRPASGESICSKDSVYDTSVTGLTSGSSVVSRRHKGRIFRRTAVSRVVKTEKASRRSSQENSEVSEVVGRHSRRTGTQRQDESERRKKASRYDNRQAPKMESFDVDSGMSLRSYLSLFEKHCRKNLKGTSEFWKAELEPKLSGDVLKTYKSMKSADDTWESLKTKLLDWYKTDKEARMSRFRTKFTKAVREEKESMFTLAMRLEKMFRTAYPSRDIERSRTLREKLFDIAPPSFQPMLKDHIVKRKMADKSICWTKIKKLASVHDSENTLERNEVVVINVAERTDNTPVVQSYNSGGEARFSDREDSGSVGRIGGAQQRFFQQRPSGGNFREVRQLSDGRQFRDNSMSRNLSVHPQFASRSRIVCNFCGKPGHYRRDCRIRTGACVACGEMGHWIANCSRAYTGRRPLVDPRMNGSASREGVRPIDNDVTRYESVGASNNVSPGNERALI